MKKYIIIIISGFILNSLFSCEKVANQVPESLITSANFFKTASDADNAINSCYDALQKNAVNYVIWGDGRTDVFQNTDRTQPNELQVSSGNVGSDNGYVTWSFLYSAINRVNGVIKNVPNITDPGLSSRKERIMGEAYFLRGLLYFYLTRTFENVPLVLEPTEDISGDLFPFQSTRDEVFVQIEKDLKLAEERVPDLPFGRAIDNKGKATKAAIRTTLADLYLWQKRYQDAADMAQLVINSPANYRLVSGSDYAKIFTDGNTSESIFEIQYDNLLQEDLNPLTDLFLPLGQAYTAGNWRFQPSQKVIDALPVNDLRRTGTFRNSGPAPAPYRDPNQTYVTKYPGTLSNNILFQDANRVIYRLAEVMLIRAEALNELPGRTADAILILNEIRRRANIGDTPAVLQDDVRLAIEQERLAELVYEGKRYYDLVRTGRYADVTGHANPNWLRWPIPAEELLINTNLDPNPGY